MIKLNKKTLIGDEAVRRSIQHKMDRLTAAFKD